VTRWLTLSCSEAHDLVVLTARALLARAQPRTVATVVAVHRVGRARGLGKARAGAARAGQVGRVDASPCWIVLAPATAIGSVVQLTSVLALHGSTGRAIHSAGGAARNGDTSATRAREVEPAAGARKVERAAVVVGSAGGVAAAVVVGSAGGIAAARVVGR